MNSRERLKEYISSDAAYQEYLGGKMQPSDFEKFCIQHCKDIEEMLNENTKLINQQKEFIEYLENEIKNSDICDVYVRGMKFNSAEKMIYKDILSKYKEIIGSKDE